MKEGLQCEGTSLVCMLRFSCGINTVHCSYHETTGLIAACLNDTYSVGKHLSDAFPVRKYLKHYCKIRRC
jgi:hypothetical protein